MQEPTMWGIHGGRTGDADGMFLKRNLIGIGWREVGDLGKLAPTRDAFKAAVVNAYPDAKPGSIPGSTGQLYRFVYEMHPGDVIVYPSKIDRLVHLGMVVGDYRYDPSNESHYPNQRPVKWLKHLPRTQFTQGALHEIGSALSLFQVRNYADEFRLAMEGVDGSSPVVEDETVALVAAEIEETTRDFILKTLAQELKGHPFAEFVAHLLNTMGYHTRVSPAGPDRGVDIVAHRDELGFEPPIIKVQVKSGSGNVGNPEVASLYGNIGATEFGLFVTLGAFTNQAKTFAEGKSNLRLLAGADLVELVLSRYDQFDSRYKGILPLKRVYIPEPLKEE